MPIDYSKYPPNWKTEIRPAILARADNCCEQCKVPNSAIICRGEWNGVVCWQDDDGNIHSAIDGTRLGDAYCGDVWVNGKQILVRIVLTISHTDHDITNNDHSNLRALCQKCHNNHDAEYRKANRKTNKEKKQPLLFG